MLNPVRYAHLSIHSNAISAAVVITLLAALAVIVLLLTGCGQKGALYLSDSEQAAGSRFIIPVYNQSQPPSDHKISDHKSGDQHWTPQLSTQTPDQQGQAQQTLEQSSDVSDANDY